MIAVTFGWLLGFAAIVHVPPTLPDRGGAIMICLVQDRPCVARG